MKELKALVPVKTFDVAETVYNDAGTPHVRLTSMFCPPANDYSIWCHDISRFGIAKADWVAEFCFLVDGDHEEEQVREYLKGFGVDVLEIWS